MTWRDQQRIGKTVRGSSLSSQEPNSYRPPEDTIDLSRIPLVNAFSPQVILKQPGTVPCLLEPLVEQFRPFHQATPWDFLILILSNAMVFISGQNQNQNAKKEEKQFRPFHQATPWDSLELTMVFIIGNHS